MNKFIVSTRSGCRKTSKAVCSISELMKDWTFSKRVWVIKITLCNSSYFTIFVLLRRNLCHLHQKGQLSWIHEQMFLFVSISFSCTFFFCHPIQRFPLPHHTLHPHKLLSSSISSISMSSLSCSLSPELTIWKSVSLLSDLSFPTGFELMKNKYESHIPSRC